MPNTLPFIAVINQTTAISDKQVAMAVAAIQKQVSFDLKSWWGKDAVLGTYSKDEQTYTNYNASTQQYFQAPNTPIPTGAWRMYFQDKVDAELSGYHSLDNQNQPIGYFQDKDVFTTILDDWTVILSHEILEILVNPNIDNYSDADIDDGYQTQNVKIIVEIADPVQAEVYQIDGVWVSDFATPSYYTDRVAIAGKKYSHTGASTAPQSLNNNGYFSYQKGTEWFQAVRENFITTYKKLSTGESLNSNQSLELLFFVGGIVAIGGMIVGAIVWYNKRNQR
jgi:hypothetical protein